MNRMDKMEQKQMSYLDDLPLFLASTYLCGSPKINISSEYQLKLRLQGVQILMDFLTWPIQSINLTMHQIGDAGMQAVLQKGKDWPNLKELAAIKNGITTDGIKGIQKIKWEKMEKLFLNNNRIDQIGLKCIVQCKFPALKQLTLGNNCVGKEGCALLSKSYWPCFQRIDLNYNLIGNEGVKLLVLAKWPSLLQINLANNKLDATACLYVKQCQWPLLQTLILNKNSIGKLDGRFTSEGCYHLSQIQSHHIKRLSIYGNDICLEGLKVILRSGKLVSNCFLELVRNNFEFDDIRPLLKLYDVFSNEFTSD